MTETTAAPAEVRAPAVAPSKKPAAKKAVSVKPRTHPPAGEMVNAALAVLKDKKGSSLQAIKKYIESTYDVDLKKQSIFIRKYLKSAVEKKIIVRANGSGASGRFKLAIKSDAEKIVKKSVAKKPIGEKKAVKKPIAKKPAGEKAVTKKLTAKKPIAAKTAKPKSSSKTKKNRKAPAAVKPKTPKPKTSASRGLAR